MDLHSLSLVLRLLRKVIGPQVRASQVEMLLIIADTPGLTQAEISDRSGMTRSTVSKAIDVFSSKGGSAGLVETRFDPSDQRRNLIYLTEKGQALLYQLQNL